jgi:Penicillin binding protein transpeptidase domain
LQIAQFDRRQSWQGRPHSAAGSSRLLIPRAGAITARLVIGTSEVSVLELVSAYAPFANGGNAAIPHVVERVRTAHGKTLYVRNAPSLGRVVDPRYVAMMNAMMRETLTSGTARKADLPGLDRRRQDRHQPGFPRRLVCRLHQPARHRRVARQR